MNSVLLFEKEKTAENRFVINSPDRVSHVLNHLKKTLNSSLKVTIMNEGVCDSAIRSMSGNSLELEIVSKPIFIPLKHTLIIGTPRPQSVKKLLEYGATFGVREFIFYQASLSEKSYADAKIFDESMIEKYLLLGLSQSACYCQIPKLTKAQEIDFEVLSKDRFLLSKEGEHTFLKVPHAKTENLCLAIGPERGFTSREEINFCANGFEKIKISKAILRTEVACLSALSQLDLMTL